MLSQVLCTHEKPEISWSTGFRAAQRFVIHCKKRVDEIGWFVPKFELKRTWVYGEHQHFRKGDYHYMLF